MSETPCTYSLFQAPWWLDAVAPGQWGEATITRDRQTVARLPYVERRRYGLAVLSMPPLTQTLGPWLRTSTAKLAKQLAEQKDLMEGLIAQLPAFDVFRACFSPTLTNGLPFYWAGFDARPMYTYRLEQLTDHERLWAGFMDNVRTDVRKAEKKVEVRTDLGLTKFLEVNALTFRRQGLPAPYPASLVERVDAACEQHAARRTYFAVDAEDRCHAAIYVVWDERVAYYLMGGADPELRGSGAMSLLLWHAIRDLADQTAVFDFEGSMIEPVERFVRGFGANQTPYFVVSKLSRRARMLQAGSELFQAVRGAAR